MGSSGANADGCTIASAHLLSSFRPSVADDEPLTNQRIRQTASPPLPESSHPRGSSVSSCIQLLPFANQRIQSKTPGDELSFECAQSLWTIDLHSDCGHGQESVPLRKAPLRTHSPRGERAMLLPISRMSNAPRRLHRLLAAARSQSH